MPSEKWGLVTIDERPKFNPENRFILSPGRYKCRLDKIKVVELPDFDSRELAPKLLFVFVPIGVEVPAGKDVSITTLCRPVMGERSNLYRLLTKMSDNGFIPEEATRDPDALQGYAEAFIGKWFNVTCKPNTKGTHNIIHQSDISPIEAPKEGAAKAKKVVAKKEVKEELPSWLKDADDPGLSDKEAEAREVEEEDESMPF